MLWHQILRSLLFIVFTIPGLAQGPDGVAAPALSGFIKFDAFYDSRQVASAREGHYLLYPLPAALNAAGEDSNAVNMLNMVNFQTRVRISINAPEALGARVFGLIETDFFGAAEGYQSMLRLRQAFLRLDWGTRQLQIGQYWTPLFTTSVYPGVISFNTGAPFQPFARHPQISYTLLAGRNLQATAALSMQRDAFQELGEGGRRQQQASGFPGMHLQIQAGNEQLLAGVAAHRRRIRPLNMDPAFTSSALTVYGKTLLQGWSVSGKLLWGEDMADHLMLGGYAVVADTLAGTRDYYPLQVVSSWMDITTTGHPWQAGLFAGYGAARGSGKSVPAEALITFAARAPELAALWRISPRVLYTAGRVRLALEIELTGAAYAGGYDPELRPRRAAGEEWVLNTRALFAAYLFF